MRGCGGSAWLTANTSSDLRTQSRLLRSFFGCVVPDAVSRNGEALTNQRFEPGQHGPGQQQHLLSHNISACGEHKLLRSEGPEMPLYVRPMREMSSRSCSERRRKARKPATQSHEISWAYKPTQQCASFGSHRSSACRRHILTRKRHVGQ